MMTHVKANLMKVRSFSQQEVKPVETILPTAMARIYNGDKSMIVRVGLDSVI